MISVALLRNPYVLASPIRILCSLQVSPGVQRRLTVAGQVLRSLLRLSAIPAAAPPVVDTIPQNRSGVCGMRTHAKRAIRVATEMSRTRKRARIVSRWKCRYTFQCCNKASCIALRHLYASLTSMGMPFYGHRPRQVSFSDVGGNCGDN